MLKSFVAWFTGQDYESLKVKETRAIVKRLSRRSVRVQNGEYMSDAEFEALRHRGDTAARRLAGLRARRS